MKDISHRSIGGISPLRFAAAPASWYYLGTISEIARHPIRFDLPLSETYVAFHPPGESVIVLAGRCSHMGADLSLGCVKDGRIACPLHGWEYGRDGACQHIPVTKEIPPFARQPAFPTEVRGGHVFFFNRAQPRFPLPFFAGIDPASLLAAKPFDFTVDAPWYLVSANGFDVQHFHCAHDRALIGTPEVDSPHPFAWRLKGKFRVTGDSIFDVVTRSISGEEVEMTVENWCGNLVLVTAKFRSTTTYGLVSFIPIDRKRTRLRDIVWIQRSNNEFARTLIDPLNAAVRRLFIREFVRSDVTRSAGIGVHPSRMLPADKVLVDYLDWLHAIHL